MLLGSCRRPDGLVGRLVHMGGGLADPEPDLYDNAFAILALSWASRALDAPELAWAAERIWTRLETSHAHPAGGYLETLPPKGPRRQNSHMHLFEAALALLAASGLERDELRARRLLVLFEDRFLTSEGHVLEHFDDQWRPLPGAPGEQIEPGHAFEWVALLHAWSRAVGEPAPNYVDLLYQAALKGLDRDGAAPLVIRVTGEPLDPSSRVWSQTEALRAHLARASAGDAVAADRVHRQLDQIFERHLDPAPAGGWIDHLDPAGRPLAGAMTAATGYHIVTAFLEAADLPSRIDPARDGARARRGGSLA
jgi:mannose-6-phosphate isomerase